MKDENKCKCGSIHASECKWGKRLIIEIDKSYQQEVSDQWARFKAHTGA